VSTIQRVAAFPLANYPNGTFDSPSRNVPDAATKLWFEVARCTDADPTIWPSASTVATAVWEYSLDGGQTWQLCGQSGPLGGGINRRRNPAGQPTAGFEVSIPPGTGRKMRGTLTISGGPLRSSAFIEFRD
jgi:hypothetical protein